MPRTTPALAARIDRLSRVAHRFHRFAHHPLCGAYEGEVVRLGRRTRICRGCLFVAAGGAAGVAASLFVPLSARVLAGLAVAGFAVLLATTSSRGWRVRGARSKVVSRLLPALTIACALGRAVQLGVTGIVCAVAGGFALLAVARIYRRRGPDRTPCASCPERGLSRPCSGIAPIVRRERAFRRLAGQWLGRVGA